MKDNFTRALAVELIFEGGYSNHPDDPGRGTMKGVTQYTYDSYRKNNGWPVQDVRVISDDEVHAIYDLQYGNKVKFNDLPLGVDIVALDGAINSGPTQCVKWLQRALGSLYSGRVDGVMGEATFAAIQSVNDYDAYIGRVLEYRMEFLKALKNWKSFKNGWTSRVNQLREIAQSWATGSIEPKLVYVKDMHMKALISDAKTKPSTVPGSLAAGAGAAVVTVTPVVQSVKTQVQAIPNLDVLVHWISGVETTLGVVGAIAATVGTLWAGYSKYKADQLRVALDEPQFAPNNAVAGAA